MNVRAVFRKTGVARLGSVESKIWQRRLQFGEETINDGHVQEGDEMRSAYVDKVEKNSSALIRSCAQDFLQIVVR